MKGRISGTGGGVGMSKACSRCRGVTTNLAGGSSPRRGSSMWYCGACTAIVHSRIPDALKRLASRPEGVTLRQADEAKIARRETIRQHLAKMAATGVLFASKPSSKGANYFFDTFARATEHLMQHRPAVKRIEPLPVICNVPVTPCRGWTGDTRIQVDPNFRGEFSRLGIGQYMEAT